MAMSRSRARLKVTSSPSSRIEPEGQFEPGDHAQRRRLAAAGRAEQAEEIAVLDREARIPHRREGAEPLHQIVDPDFGHGLLREFGDEGEHHRRRSAS
jgi:hypothetical protein